HLRDRRRLRDLLIASLVAIHGSSLGALALPLLGRAGQVVRARSQVPARGPDGLAPRQQQLDQRVVVVTQRLDDRAALAVGLDLDLLALGPTRVGQRASRQQPSL